MFAVIAQSLRRAVRRPIRSVLTVLQVALAMLAVTVAFHAVQARIRATLPSDVFYVVAGKPGSYAYGLFRSEDLPKLKQSAADIEALEVMAGSGRVTLELSGQRYQIARGLDVGLNFDRVVPITWIAGAFFDSSARDSVAISENVAKKLFPNQNPVGRTVNYGAITSFDVPPYPTPHKIIGVFKNDSLSLPLVLSRFSSTSGMSAGASETLIVRAKAGRLETARSSLMAAIRKLYSNSAVRGSGAFRNFNGEVYSSNRSDFSVKSVTGLDPQSLTFTAFALVILITSLIGVFSIQLVDVFERTREISMRRVLGATQTRVMLEIVLDGLLLSSLGGGLGVLGAALVFPALQNASGPFVFTRGLQFEPALALSLLIIVILVVALLSAYPALLASRLKPVEALRES